MTAPKPVYLVRCIVLCLFLGLATHTAAQTANLVSNVDGKIKVIILHLGDGAYFDGFWFDMSVLIRDLIQKMDRDVGFVILHGRDDSARRMLEGLQPFAGQMLPDGTRRLKYLAVEVKTGDFYPWARDAYFIQQDAAGKLIFLDSGFNFKPFPVTGFKRIFKDAVIRAGLIPRGGGNVRTTNSEVFIGMDTILGIDMTPRWSPYGHIRETLYTVAEQYQAASTQDLKRIFNAHADFLHHVLAPDRHLTVPGRALFFDDLEQGAFLFSKKTVHHTGAQAAYHTDVYLGLGHVDKGGRRVLFVADSGRGGRLVAGLSPARRRAVEAALPGLLAREGFTAAGIPVSRQQIARRFQWSTHKLLDRGLEKAQALQPVFDRVALHLETRGFRIVRIPCLPNGLTNGLTNSQPAHDRAMGVAFNYSNVLTEVYQDVRRVYIPRYGFAELDAAAAAAYARAGYEVIFIEGLLTNALTAREHSKGLDCLTSEIRSTVQWTPSGDQ